MRPATLLRDLSPFILYSSCVYIRRIEGDPAFCNHPISLPLSVFIFPSSLQNSKIEAKFKVRSGDVKLTASHSSPIFSLPIHALNLLEVGRVGRGN